MFNNFRNTFPEDMSIPQKQLENAKLYRNRWYWITTLNKNISVMEVGVAAGDFSAKIIEHLNPYRLVLVDTFVQCDPILAANGRELRYLEGENEAFVRNRFKNNPEVEVVVGLSQEVLPKLNEKFDMIYLDASHQYNNICTDIENSIPLLKEDGILALNDYTIYNPDGDDYGVIKACNQFLIANPNWEVVGFSLNEEMYCDIYLKKIK